MGMPETFSAALRAALHGPYARSIMESSPSMLDQLDRDVKALGEDLRILAGQIRALMAAGKTGHDLPMAQEWVNLRISLEHLVVLTAGVIPLVAAAVADWHAQDPLRSTWPRGGRIRVQPPTLEEVDENFARRLLTMEIAAKELEARWSRCHSSFPPGWPALQELDAVLWRAHVFGVDSLGTLFDAAGA